MDGDRGGGIGVLDHVVFERRDQRAGLADAGEDHGLPGELHHALLRIAAAHRERRHLDAAAVDALDAPDAGVIVERGALALSHTIAITV